MIESSGEIYSGTESDNASISSNTEDGPIETLSDFEKMTTLTIDAKVSETYEPLFATSNQRIMQGDVYAVDMWIENEIRKAVQQTHKNRPRPFHYDLNSATDDALLAYNRNNADRSQFSAGEVNVNGLCVRDFADVDDTDDGPHPVQLTQAPRLPFFCPIVDKKGSLGPHFQGSHKRKCPANKDHDCSQGHFPHLS